MQWAVCVELISNAAVSYFQSALNSGMVKSVTNLRSGHKGHQGTLVLLDSECTAHDTHLRTHFSWWPAAVEVGVSIPPKVNQAEVMIERARSTQRCVVHVFCC